MEEIRAIALAYYHNFSNNQKHDVYAAFKQIDKNGDGTITFDEFEEFFDIHDRSSFKALDTNGDGKIDFEEFITLYYFINSAMVSCDGNGCEEVLQGVYFTCLGCFHRNKTTTFDLCTSCYRHRNFVHEHNTFLDSHLLLRCQAAHAQVGSNSSEDYGQAVKSGDGTICLHSSQVKRSVSKREVAIKVFDSVNSGINLGQAIVGAVGACSIL